MLVYHPYGYDISQRNSNSLITTHPYASFKKGVLQNYIRR